KPPGVAGVARVASAPYADPTQLDPKSDYYDEKASADAPRWMQVDVEHVETFDELVPLDALKAEKALEGMMVVQRGVRFSVQPVDKKHFARVLKMAGAKTRA